MLILGMTGFENTTSNQVDRSKLDVDSMILQLLENRSVTKQVT